MQNTEDVKRSHKKMQNLYAFDYKKGKKLTATKPKKWQINRFLKKMHR